MRVAAFVDSGRWGFASWGGLFNCGALGYRNFSLAAGKNVLKANARSNRDDTAATSELPFPFLPRCHACHPSCKLHAPRQPSKHNPQRGALALGSVYGSGCGSDSGSDYMCVPHLGLHTKA